MKGAGLQRVQLPPGNRFAPPGSNRSGSGGNEAVGAFGVKTQDQGTVIPLDGARIFQNYCASCHGVNGNGDGPVAPALKAKVPQLTTLAQRNGGMFSAERVHRIITGDDVSATHGSREMPIWGPIFHEVEYDQDLGYVRLQNVTEYLNTIQQK